MARPVPYCKDRQNDGCGQARDDQKKEKVGHIYPRTIDYRRKGQNA
jgi:hypothetical protein